jgi:hypothetical protein
MTFLFSLYSVFRFMICKALHNCYSILAVQEWYSEENLCHVCGSARIMQFLPRQLCTIYEESPTTGMCNLTFILLGQHFWTLFSRLYIPLGHEVKMSKVYYKYDKFYSS